MIEVMRFRHYNAQVKNMDQRNYPGNASVIVQNSYILRRQNQIL